MPAAPVSPDISRASATEVKAGIKGSVLKPEIAAKQMAEMKPWEKAIVEAGAKQLQAGRGLEALKPLASGFTRTEWQPTVDSLIQTDFDANGNRIARGVEETNRVNEVSANMKMYEEYLFKGFDGITDDPPNPPGGRTADQKKAALKVQMANLIKSNPVLFDALGDAATGDVSDINLESFLRQDGLRIELAQILNEDLDPNNIPKDKEQDYRNAKAALDKAQTEKTNLEAQKQTYLDAPNKRTQFDNDAYGPRGSKLQTVNAIRGELAASADPGINGLQNNLDELRTVNEQLKANPTNNRLITRNNQLNRWIDEAKADAVFGPRCTEFINLYQDSLDINDLIREAPVKTVLLDAKINAKTQEVANAQANFDNISQERQRISKEFTDSMNNAVLQAGQEYLNKRVLEFVQTYKSISGGEIEGAVKGYLDQMKGYLDTRWAEKYRPKTIANIVGGRGREALRVNKKQAKADFEMLATAGPDRLIEQILTDAGVPSNERVLMMQNSKFMATQRSELTAKALAAYVGAGGKLTEAHINVLALTSYGEAALQGMLDKNAATKALIEQARKGGVLKDGTVAEMKKKFGGRGLLGLLLMSMGIAVVGGAGFVK